MMSHAKILKNFLDSDHFSEGNPSSNMIQICDFLTTPAGLEGVVINHNFSTMQVWSNTSPAIYIYQFHA